MLHVVKFFIMLTHAKVCTTRNTNVHYSSIIKLRNWGECLGSRPLLHFTLRLRTGLLIEAQHILHLRLRPCIVSSFQLPIYLRPTLKITHLRPNSHQYYWSLIGIYYDGTMHGKHFATGWEEIYLMV